jgi:SAM-dependent methyltransferase
METRQQPETGINQGFDARMITALNEAAMVVMCSVGHRTGLFDSMHEAGWIGSRDLSDRAGLDERYVREWLGAMAVSRVVETRPDGTFRLPDAHSAMLTRKAGANNVAVFAQYIPVIAAVEDDIVGCFRNGGGVPYDRYPRFHEVMAEDSAATVLSALESDILPLVPGLVDRLEDGIDVLDVGCGRGRAMLQLAERFPRSRFHGFDLSTDAIAWGRQEAERRDLSNIHLRVYDGVAFAAEAEPERYDFVTTFDAVHDQADPNGVLAGIQRTLKADGVYLMQDIHAHSHAHDNLEHPLGSLLYTLSCMHCMPVSLAQNGAGLGAMWGREVAITMLTEAGFADVEVHRLEHDIQNDYYVIRKTGRGLSEPAAGSVAVAE